MMFLFCQCLEATYIILYQSYKLISHIGTMSCDSSRTEGSANHKRELEERWKIEEVDFNIWGLNAESFLAP